MSISLPPPLQKYSNEAVEKQLKVKRLFFLECLIFGLLLLFLPFLFNNLEILLVIVTLLAANGLAIVSLLKGKLLLSENFHFGSLVAGFIMALLFATDRGYDLPIFTMVATIFLLDILLTSSQKWKVYLFVALMIIVPLISRTLYLSDLTLEEHRFMTINDLILFEIMVVGIGISAIVLFRDSGNLLKMMLAKAEENEQRYRAVKELLSQSQGSLEIGDTMEKSSNETLSAVNDIEEDMNSIRDGISSLNSTVDNYSSNSVIALKVAGELEKVSQEQSSSIAESASIIEEMSASIRNVSNVSTSKKKNLEVLTDLARNSQEKMEEMDTAMVHIEKTGAEVMDIISIIDNVASQTNLLAMNAAIEAAHAGDAGKGFSVVSDEIRKLSEATNENTKIIKKTIEASNSSIRSASIHNKDVAELIETMRGEIGSVAESINEIISSLMEMSSGTEEVTTAVASLRNISVHTDDLVKELRDKITNNDKEIESISAMAQHSSEKVDRTLSAFHEIVSRTQNVLTLGQETKSAMEILNTNLSKI